MKLGRLSSLDLQNARVFVVVPAYNEARLIGRTLSSIPAWVEAGKATLTVNGERMEHLPVNNGYAPVRVVWKPVLTSSDAILRLAREASADDACIGLAGRNRVETTPVLPRTGTASSHPETLPASLQ